MGTIWRPGVAILNRLTYPRKFALISLLFILPLVLVLALLLQELNARVAFAQKERVGTQYLRPLHKLFAHMIQSAALKPAPDELRRQIDQDFEELAAADRRYGDELQTTPLFQALQVRWQALDEQAAPQSDARATQLIGHISTLIAQTGDSSNLILDPDLDSFYLMDNQVRNLPEAAELLAEALVLGESGATRGALTIDQRGRLIVLAGLLRSNAEKTRRTMQVAFQANSTQTLPAQLTPVLLEHTITTEAFLETLDRELLNAQQITIQPSTYVALGAQALEARFKLWDHGIIELDGLLQARIALIWRTIFFIGLFSLAALAVVSYLLAALYHGVMLTISSLEDAARRMSSGTVAEMVQLDNRDELAQVARSFNSIASALVSARVAAEEANALKTKFLANMSHELRTPLNAIINFTHFLGDPDYGTLNDQQQLFHSRVIYNAEHLLGLINDILDLVKIEAGKMDLQREQVDLQALLHGVMSTGLGLTKTKGLELTLDAPDELPPIWADKTRIRQVLINLVSNAAKFTDQGGITVRARKLGGFVQIAVQDTGIGIGPKDQARIFDEFQQVQDSMDRSYGGTGLGLPISRRLIEMHGGQIELESAPGAGSTFRFSIPVAPPAAPEEQIALGGPLITVVDDDLDSHRILRHILGGAGYQVRSILDSRGALDELRRHIPALIILDLIMEPVDGWAVLADLQRDPLLREIPVVICTVADAVREEVGLLANVQAHIQKPVRRDDLIALVRQITPGAPVLVVDDSSDDRRVLSMVIESIGYEAITAPDGAAALVALARDRPSLVLLDLMMPEMDGFMFLERMQSYPEFADIPVVVISAKDLDAAERAWLNERTRACLRKPLDAPTFVTFVQQLLKGAAYVP
jgi:signal transduction histidine kinase/DNA-binding response OmpR family regulator